MTPLSNCTLHIGNSGKRRVGALTGIPPGRAHKRTGIILFAIGNSQFAVESGVMPPHSKNQSWISSAWNPARGTIEYENKPTPHRLVFARRRFSCCSCRSILVLRGKRHAEGAGADSPDGLEQLGLLWAIGNRGGSEG